MDTLERTRMYEARLTELLKSVGLVNIKRVSVSITAGGVLGAFELSWSVALENHGPDGTTPRHAVLGDSFIFTSSDSDEVVDVWFNQSTISMIGVLTSPLAAKFADVMSAYNDWRLIVANGIEDDFNSPIQLLVRKSIAEIRACNIAKEDAQAILVDHLKIAQNIDVVYARQNFHLFDVSHEQ